MSKLLPMYFARCSFRPSHFSPPRLLISLFLGILAALSAQAQLFVQPKVIPTTNWPSAVYSADINSDGFPDLLYIDQVASPGAASTTHVLLNDGRGNFTQSAQVATSGASIAIADFDGDGQLDLAWAVASITGTTAYIASGAGSGSFGPPHLFASIPPILGAGTSSPQLVYATAVKFLDLGPPCLLVEDTANQQLLILGDPLLQSSPLTYGAGPIFSLDLDEDGHADIVVQGSGGTTTALFGDGNGYLKTGPGLTPERFYTGSGVIHSLLLRDVDGDGHLDFIAEGTNGRIDVFPGNGDGTFQTTSVGGTGSLDGLTGNGGHLIALADFNQDGQLDALTATPAGISTLLGQGTAYFGLKGIYNAGPGRTSFVVADFNGDGHPDLAVDSPEGIAILFGNSDGSFQANQSFAAGQPATSAAIAAFTPSGKLDAAVGIAPTQAQLLFGNGDGTFLYAGSPNAPTPTYTQPGPAGLVTTVQAADLNADGNPDLVLTTDGPNAVLPNLESGVSGLVVQLGNGDGTFADPVAPNVEPQFTFPNPSTCSPPFDHYPGALFGTSAIADLNGDGLPDIASRDPGGYRILRGNDGSPQESYSNIPTLYFSDPDGALTDSEVDCHLHAHDLTIVGDTDNDGVANLIVQGSLGNSGALLVYSATTSSNASRPGDLSVAGSLTTPGQLLAPSIDTVFGGVSSTLGFPAFPGSGVVADLDRDGNNDLIVTYANLAANLQAPSTSAPNYIYIWFGSGGGKFLVTPQHPVNPVRFTPSRNFYQVAVADLNYDGIPDLILSDGYILSIQYGVGDGTFGQEQHFLAGQGLNTISIADVNGDGKPDIILANGGTVLANPVANRNVINPNPDVNTGGITVLLNTYAPPTSPTATLDLSAVLTAAPDPATFEGPFTLTVAFAPPAGAPGPTGLVSFAVDASSTGSAPVVSSASNYTATLPIPTYAQGSPASPLLPGTHAITAAYSGDSTYAADSSLIGTIVISLGPTTVTFTPTTPVPAPYGGPVNGTFQVNVVDPHYPATGTYTLYDNGVAVPACTNLPLTIVCPYGDPQILPVGSHALSVAYNGGPSNGDPINASSASPATTYTVVPDTVTTAVLTSSLNPATLGTSVTFTATLTGSPATPTGSVQFLEGSTVLATATLSPGGIATFTTSTLTVGTHNITVFYAATSNFAAGTSNLVAQQIVNPSTPPPISPTGPNDFTLTITPDPITLGVGRTAGLQVAIQAGGGFAEPVLLSCSGLPQESSCTFDTPILPAGAAITMLQLHVSAPHDCGDPNSPYFLGQGKTPPLPGRGTGLTLAALLLTGGGLLRKRKKLLASLILIASLTSLTLLSGCGRCTDLGTYAGAYTFNVTATAQGANAQTHTQTIHLTVTL